MTTFLVPYTNLKEMKHQLFDICFVCRRQPRFNDIYWLCFPVSDGNISNIYAFLEVYGHFQISRWPTTKVCKEDSYDRQEWKMLIDESQRTLSLTLVN